MCHRGLRVLQERNEGIDALFCWRSLDLIVRGGGARRGGQSLTVNRHSHLVLQDGVAQRGLQRHAVSALLGEGDREASVQSHERLRQREGGRERVRPRPAVQLALQTTCSQGLTSVLLPSHQ